jgi:hypothetical protein
VQHAQHRGCFQLIPGNVQRRRERGQQIGPQPVQQPPLVACRPGVVTRDRPQLGGHRAVRDQRAERAVPIEGQQAADPGVLGIVLLARRAPAPGHQVRIDRDHRETRVDQRVHQRPVPRLEHHPNLGRVRFQDSDPRDQPV